MPVLPSIVKKCFFAVKQATDSKSWDSRKDAGIGTKDEIRAINSYLEDRRRVLGNLYQQMALKGRYLTPEALRDAYFNKEVEVNKLSDLFRYHNDTAITTIKPITLKHYLVIQRYLQRFISYPLR